MASGASGLTQLLWRTRNVVCVGRNYVAHAAELKNQVPTEPFWFLKPVSSLVRPGERQRIEIPEGCGEVHHEAELAVVIGSTASRVSREDAESVIAGYATAVDATGRDLQQASKKAGLPWSRAKGYDTWCPISEVVDKAAVPNPADLTVCLSVNGEERQRGSTSLMVFDIPTLIEAITDVVTLGPGDLILTGTPAGVGKMEPGDKVRCWIEGLDVPALELDVESRPSLMSRRASAKNKL